MTLLDLRRYAVSNRLRIRFALPSGVECCMDEHGILKIPSLRSAPDFNVETLLPSVENFSLDPIQEGRRSRNVSREQLELLCSGGGAK